MTTQNYFKILNVPEKLIIDHNELKKNYFNLLKENSQDPILDPAGKHKDNKKQLALIEAAYQTLKDRITRIEHLLNIEGIKVANDNRPPTFFAPLAKEIKILLESYKKDQSALSKLKEIHADVLTEFSTASIELARLENAWDNSHTKEIDILKKLKRKSAAFTYFRNIEQDIRDAID